MQTLKKAVDLTDLAVGIIVLGIAVTIGVTILLNVRDNRLTTLDSVSTVSEVVTSVNEQGDTLTNSWVSSVTSCANATGGVPIESGNYTTTINSIDGYADIAFKSTNAADIAKFNNSNWECNYTWYNTSRVDWNLPNQAATGIGEYGNWFSIIVIVGVSAVVLSLIFLAFGRGSTGSVGSSSGIGGSY